MAAMRVAAKANVTGADISVSTNHEQRDEEHRDGIVALKPEAEARHRDRRGRQQHRGRQGQPQHEAGQQAARERAEDALPGAQTRGAVFGLQHHEGGQGSQ